MKKKPFSISTMFTMFLIVFSLGALPGTLTAREDMIRTDDGLSQPKVAVDVEYEHGLAPVANRALTTLFAENNGFRGNSFDLEATNECLVVTGWDFNFTNSAGVTGDVSIYWREGTASGFENTAAGWNLLGTNSVTTAGNNLPTHLNVGGLKLPAGELIGIYYYVETYPNPRTGYTDGGPTLFSNADLELTTYAGIGTPKFGTSFFNYRQVNATVYYEPCFNKEIVSGNDFDFNGIPDRVVEVGTVFFGANYIFSINHNDPGGPNVMIKDIVPREWNATFVGGSAPCSVIRADERRNLFSDNFITCYPGDYAAMFFQAAARCGDTPGDPTCHPYECGAFYLNEGAQAWVGRALLDQTEPLCLAAVKDMNGGGLDYTGAGDEDGDGVDDYTEACINFTDPCDAGSNSPGRR